MTGPGDRFEPVENEEILDAAAIARDDALLAELAGNTWTCSEDMDVDPAAGLLAALRDDVDQDLPAADDPVPLPGVVDLSTRRRLRERLASRTAVAGVVAFAVLSAGGVAAAGIAGGESGPLGPVHRLLVGESDSERAAKQVRNLLADAEGFLDTGQIEKCADALKAAEAWLAEVDPDDVGGLADRLAKLERRYGDAGYNLEDDNSGPGSGDDRGGDDDNSGPGSGDDRSGDDDNSGPGSGDGDNSGSGSGDDDNSGSGSGGSDDDNSGSGSGDDDNSGPGSGGSDDDRSGSGSGKSGGGDDEPDGSSGSGSGSGSDSDDD